MKRALKWFGGVAGSVVLLVACFLAYVQVTGIPRYPHVTPVRTVAVTPERAAAGRKIATMLCAGCHLDPATGRFTGKRLSDLPAEFGEIYSRNITASTSKGIGAWTDGELAYLLRTGLRPDGTYLPPYMVKLPHLSDEHLDSLIAFLRSGDPLVAPMDVDPPGRSRPSLLAKVLTHLVMKPLPYPTGPIVAPPKSDTVAYGRYLVTSLDCFSCHSASFKTIRVMEPEKSPGFMGGGNALTDLNGRAIRSANLTPDAKTGIGRWSASDFSRAVRRGIRPDGHPLHYPMLPIPELSEEDVSAMFAYLRTIPAIENAVERYRDPIPAGDAGKRAYFKYGCVSCHGENGVGVADLRTADRHYPTDGALLEWILDAPRLEPDTKMPAWRGVIAETDYGPLLAHVRKLAAKGRGETAQR